MVRSWLKSVLSKAPFLSHLVFCVSLQPGLLVAAPLPSVSELRTQYIQSLTSIPAYEATMDVAWTSRTDKNFPDALSHFTIHRRQHGRRCLIDIAGKTDAAITRNHWIAAYDGQRFTYFTEIDETKDGLPFVPKAAIGFTRPPQLNYNLTFSKLNGECLWGIDLHLRDLIGKAPFSVKEWEDVAGHTCVRAEVGPYELGTKNPSLVKTIAWFDPAVGFLPRRILNLRPDTAPHLDEADAGWETLVSEYREVSAPSGNVWLPVSGILQSRTARYELMSNDVTILASIPAERFQVEMTPGTRVTESLPNGKHREWTVGEESARDELMAAHQRYRVTKGIATIQETSSLVSPAELKAIPETSTKHANPAPDARPTRSLWLSVRLWGALLGVAVLLCASFGLWRARM